MITLYNEYSEIDEPLGEIQEEYIEEENTNG